MTHPPVSTSLTYCDAKIVIEEKCLRCHVDGGDAMTPFNLESYEEVFAQKDKMKRAVETEFMPLVVLELSPPVESLSESEKELLIEWIEGGAPAGDCE